MKINAEVDVFGDSEYCRKGSDWCKFLVLDRDRRNNGETYYWECVLFEKWFKIPGKCEPCKKAYKEAMNGSLFDEEKQYTVNEP